MNVRGETDYPTGHVEHGNGNSERYHRLVIDTTTQCSVA